MTGDVLFHAVSMRYADVRALHELTLAVPAGQITAVIGPSGSGKSTLLKICAGILTPTSGRILIGDSDITTLPPERRDIGFVFQSYALFPHLTVGENVAFPLRTRRHRQPAHEARERAERMLDRVGLHGLARRRPAELSGGQQQRVALARALVFGPRLLLLDEPLGALDAQVKQQLQDDIRRLRDELGVTVIYVTHDQSEAMSIANRVAILRDGVLQQVDAPEAIYDHPANEFVATFVGAGNLVRGRIEAVEATETIVTTAVGRMRAAGGTTLVPGEEGILLIRPEILSVRAPGVSQGRSPGTENRASAIVRHVTFAGSFLRLRVDVAPDTSWLVDAPRHAGAATPRVDQPVELCWAAADTRIVGLPASVSAPKTSWPAWPGLSHPRLDREAAQEVS